MKSNEFIIENTVTVDDVNAMLRKARLEAKEIFNSAFPIPIRSVARGGDGMRSLVFTFQPADVRQHLAGKSDAWDTLAKKVEQAFAQHKMKAKLQQVIWKNNGELRVKPKVILTVDTVSKLEDLYFKTAVKKFK